MATTPVYVKPYRALGSFIADVVVEEHHVDESILTEIPVEQGSTISDHYYAKPAEVTMEYVWDQNQNSDGDPNYFMSLYQKLLTFKQSAQLFAVYTGKRVYQNMLIKSMAVVTDKETENILNVRFTCQEVLLATTTTASVSNPSAPTSGQQNMSNPQGTAPTIPKGFLNLLPAPNYSDTSGVG